MARTPEPTAIGKGDICQDTIVQVQYRHNERQTDCQIHNSPGYVSKQQMILCFQNHVYTNMIRRKSGNNIKTKVMSSKLSCSLPDKRRSIKTRYIATFEYQLRCFYTHKEGKELYFGIFTSQTLLKHLKGILCLPALHKNEYHKLGTCNKIILRPELHWNRKRMVQTTEETARSNKLSQNLTEIKFLLWCPFLFKTHLKSQRRCKLQTKNILGSSTSMNKSS